jgi:hypothetical protein
LSFKKSYIIKIQKKNDVIQKNLLYENPKKNNYMESKEDKNLTASGYHWPEQEDWSTEDRSTPARRMARPLQAIAIRRRRDAHAGRAVGRNRSASPPQGDPGPQSTRGRVRPLAQGLLNRQVPPGRGRYCRCRLIQV